MSSKQISGESLISTFEPRQRWILDMQGRPNDDSFPLFEEDINSELDEAVRGDTGAGPTNIYLASIVSDKAHLYILVET